MCMHVCVYEREYKDVSYTELGMRTGLWSRVQ